MNFFFGQIYSAQNPDQIPDMESWLNKTIFDGLKDCQSTYAEAGFSLTLINDPKKLCKHQSGKIHVDKEYACTSDCILYNKQQLADQLGISDQASNEQIIISSFKKWGELFADKFDGKFSFVLWDRKNRKLLGGRDALGYGNLCYSQINDRLFFASDLATLLDQPLVDKSINRRRFYQCFRYANNPPTQTYFKHCHYCPPSHILEFTDVLSTTDYWRLGTKALQANDMDEPANCSNFISILNQAIENEQSENSATGLMLSGGFDSSLLAAIIAGNNSWKQSLTCYSYIFKQHTSSDESRFINQTLNKLNLDSRQINGDEHYVFSELPGRTIYKDIINLDGYAALPEAIFNMASQDSKTLLILGHFGDDLFAGNQYKFADLISSGEFKSIFNMIRNSDTTFSTLNELINFGIRPLLPAPVKKLFRKIFKPKDDNDVFAIKDSQINNIGEEIKHNKRQSFHRQKLLKLVYFTNTAEGIYYYRKHLYLGHGLKYVMPFYSKQMIEFFWNLPINLLNKPNKYRWLQRQSLSMVGLKHIAERTTKTQFVDLFSTGINKKRQLIIQIIKRSKLYDEMMLPENIMKKLEMAAEIDTNEAVATNQYLLTALWLEAISDSTESFNQPMQISVESKNLRCRKKNLWSLDH